MNIFIATDVRRRATNFPAKNRLWRRLYHQTMDDDSFSSAGFGVQFRQLRYLASNLDRNHGLARPQ